MLLSNVLDIRGEGVGRGIPIPTIRLQYKGWGTVSVDTKGEGVGGSSPLRSYGIQGGPELTERSIQSIFRTLL